MAKVSKMLSVRDVAERLGAAESSVRLWADQGRFKGAVRQESPRGPYWSIPEDSLVSFERVKPGPKPKTAGPAKNSRKKPK
jgi:hypothetical protein